jgi:F-type H+-transporting ATPase subunit epsilon
MILEIVSPEATLFTGEVTSVSVPGINGEFQMLNNHAPIVSILTKGSVKIQASSFNVDKAHEDKFSKLDTQTYSLSINSGTIEMNNNKVIVLAD